MVISVIIIAFIGLCLSAYAFFVEQKIAANPTYKPVCDLSDRISCTKPLASKYGKFFGVNNTVFGLIFYAAMIVAALFNAHTLMLYGAIAACCVTVVLAYILYFKIHSFCLVCSSIYLVNICLLIAICSR